MPKTNQKLVVLFVFILIFIEIFSFHGESFAALNVELQLYPNKTNITIGPDGPAPDRISLKTKVREANTNITFQWELDGPGKLDGLSTEPSIFYVSPEEIDGQSVEATVTVIVSDEMKNKVSKSVTFNIISLPTPTPTPPPTPAPEPSGMSGLTKTVITFGAGAAVGAGITYLIKDDCPDCPELCGGVEVGNYCWYLGAEGQSCETVCASHKEGYDEATRMYAGSNGTDNNCYTVLRALGAPVNFEDKVTTEQKWTSLGCCYWVYEGRTRWTRDDLSPTNSGTSYPTIQRACACTR